MEGGLCCWLVVGSWLQQAPSELRSRGQFGFFVPRSADESDAFGTVLVAGANLRVVPWEAELQAAVLAKAAHGQR